jgi:chromosome partitioning protein
MTTPSVDRSALRRTIAVLNGKGGVGKTSLTANLSGLFADAGYRVLAIDLDPQGNLGNDLGYLGAGMGDGGAGLVVAGTAGTAPHLLKDVRPGLDVVVGGDQLHDLASVLQSRRSNGRGGGVSSLAAAIAAVAGNYDLTFIDCPPGNDVLQAGALEAARWVLVPTKTDDASRAGLREVARRFTDARRSNPNLALLGVALFGVNSSAKRVIATARENLGSELGGQELIFASTIRHVEAAAVDARNRGQLVHELERDVVARPKWYERLRNPDSRAEPLASSAGVLAEDYQAMAEEVIGRILAAEPSQDSVPV